MVGKKKKKVLRSRAETKVVPKAPRCGGSKTKRRTHKLERRKQEKKTYSAEMWRAPAPTHLVATLDQPRVKSKHKSYFEFADNPERRKKKLEFEITNQPLDKYPGYAFVPIGDPALTNACKELSRDQDAMIFIVSSHTSKDDNTKISEHVHRTGYYFREAIVDQAREIVGETVISNPTILPGTVESIPESQEEINKQADAAMKDLFPRIPNPDRVMIIEHAFKKGAVFHGEPTVGLQAGIPLSRRVQLAVLAHIRHTHTRYDKLLRETTWINARKAVEPVCLDVLIKWRGDEETGRDQMDEILREIVIITDSEDEENDSSEENTSDEEDEVTSASSTEPSSQPNSRNQQRPQALQARMSANIPAPAVAIRTDSSAISSRTRAKNLREKEQRGFKRYQAAWQDAINRRQAPRSHTGTPYQDSEVGQPRLIVACHASGPRYPLSQSSRADPTYIQHRPPALLRSEVNFSYPERAVYLQDIPSQHPETLSNVQYRQSVPQHPGTIGNSQHPTMGHQPPPVVRRSPVKHGLEDLLVPSIETASSDVLSPRIREWNGPHVPHATNHSRVVGPRAQTPAAHQVIVIDDDSPHVKRRRLVREDASGHFRPLPSRNHSFPVRASNSDSLTLRSSTIKCGTLASTPILRLSRASTQSAQGLLRDTEAFFTDPVTGERLPIYDAPLPEYVSKHPGYVKREEERGYSNVQREAGYGARPMGHSQPLDDPYYRQPMNFQSGHETPEYNVRGGSARQLDKLHNPERKMRQMSPEISASHQPSHSDGMISRPGGPDQEFIQKISQYHLDGPSSLARDGSTAVPTRFQENFAIPGSRHHQHNHIGSYEPLNRARSPIRYVERPPLQVREPSQQSPYYNHEYPARLDRDAYHNNQFISLPERQQSSFDEVPMFVRTIPTANTRPVIYLK